MSDTLIHPAELAYRGYFGSFNRSIEDKCYYGKILHITDLVLYGADTSDEMQKEFENAVDNYLSACKKIKKEPNKSKLKDKP